MAIDMTACVGCNACVVACQAENNIPIVGKQGVIRGREMHWLRLDLYYEGEPDNPQAVHQPMLCQHCEKAPCEVVCPVMATTHSGEGLNEMTYNRCVGTRYCSNNCPYKVRRFNFFEYNAPRRAGAQAAAQSRGHGPQPRRDGEVHLLRAADQRRADRRQDRASRQRRRAGDRGRHACKPPVSRPARPKAIVFGNINDADSQVAKLKRHPLNYGVLSEIGTQPRTTYLARVRNPNPATRLKHLTESDPWTIKCR